MEALWTILCVLGIAAQTLAQVNFPWDDGPGSDVDRGGFGCDVHNGSCEMCVRDLKCLWCNNTSLCLDYPRGRILPHGLNCSLSDVHWGICWINLEVLLIAAAVVAGVLIITIVVCCCWCCCRCCKQPQSSRDEEQWSREQEVKKRQAQKRKAERRAKQDQIRKKYGLLKDEEAHSLLI
ncbi:pituitary tumor-transforming gene 1 protein-interacting protein-like [Lethenteron reissneri]|uniref:pituitary tumor-transforming gene 1 protein-interacting protein-like n=1 Tax=Lethenteron reissneri TaxID=7753 RepID=UPI002AB6B92E|nr:pituitary tumor-transforming gene 1 protein-interacting protein-like [Lethenteron reissneri]